MTTPEDLRVASNDIESARHHLDYGDVDVDGEVMKDNLEALDEIFSDAVSILRKQAILLEAGDGTSRDELEAKKEELEDIEPEADA